MTLFVALALAAGQAATSPAAPATMQARFDAASDAATAGRCADAIRAFDGIEQGRKGRAAGLVDAAIAVRKGGCLVATGRSAEGEASIRRGLPTLEAQGSGFAADVRDARLALAAAAQDRFDDTAVEAEAERALAVSTGPARIRPLMLLARVRMFDHDGRALKSIEEARGVLAAMPGATKADIAAVQTLYARILLNEGRNKEGYAALKDSLQKQGGLTSKVTLSDVATRSDLAIAALLNHDMDNARLYLAYTGAGRVGDTPFGRAIRMDPPFCGEATGLKRDDRAIVEFSLADDGRVIAASTIYTPGNRDVANAFARAVADWSWRAEDAVKIKPFFRAATRVEMRCTTAAERTGITEPLTREYAAWLAGRGVGEPAWRDMTDARALPLQRAAFDRATKAGDKAAALQAAMAMVRNAVLADKERQEIAAQASVLATALGPPAGPRTYLMLGTAMDTPDYRRGYRMLLADPVIAADPVSAASLRLLIAQPGYRQPPPTDADALLDAVIAAPDADALKPLKVNALLQKANLLAGKGDLAGARAAFDRTGLTEEQCALIGLTPAMRRSGASSNDFPMAAQQMGFEGWVTTEFDVAADGRTVAPRAVVAYPPFVFDDAATGIARDARYASSFRPSGAVACSANRQSVNFRLP